MRRNARSLILIIMLVILSGLVLGIPNLKIRNFERGGNTLLGLSLGLDLQGGSHLVYKANVVDELTGEPIEPTPEEMAGLKRIIERRINNSGLGEPIIQLLGTDRLLVQLPGVRDSDRAKSLIGETAQLSFKHRVLNVSRPVNEISSDDIINVRVGYLSSPEEESLEEESLTEEEGDTQAKTSASDDEDSSPSADSGPAFLFVQFSTDGAAAFANIMGRMQQEFEVFIASGGRGPQSSIELSIYSEPPIKYQLSVLELIRVNDTNEFAFVLPKLRETEETPTKEEAEARIGENPVVSFVEILGAMDEDFGLTGENLLRAYPSQQSNSGIPIVNLEFDNDGTRKFGEKTSEIAGSSTDQIAIFLDGQELISPVVTTAITTGVATIQGGFTIERARDIALLLESGRLPVPVELIQERDVDAILGADSLQKSVQAGLVGLALVLLFMVLNYRVPGVIASIALIIYAGILLSIFKILPVTLTLSGIAALILSVGMAVDANILIFERMKDELRLGRTLMSAINIGFDRAWPAIRDGNVSTLITCGILFWFSDQLGTTVVQGFAATLAFGVMISMFSAIVVSRTLLRLVATTRLSHRTGLFLSDSSRNKPRKGNGSPVG